MSKDVLVHLISTFPKLPPLFHYQISIDDNLCNTDTSEKKHVYFSVGVNTDTDTCDYVEFIHFLNYCRCHRVSITVVFRVSVKPYDPTPIA